MYYKHDTHPQPHVCLSASFTQILPSHPPHPSISSPAPPFHTPVLTHKHKFGRLLISSNGINPGYMTQWSHLSRSHSIKSPFVIHQLQTHLNALFTSTLMGVLTKREQKKREKASKEEKVRHFDEIGDIPYKANPASWIDMSRDIQSKQGVSSYPCESKIFQIEWKASTDPEALAPWFMNVQRK